MTVTKIEPLSKTRYKVYLDGEFAFVLYKGELAQFGVREDGELSEETAGKIRAEVVAKRAKIRAMHLLEDMDRTEAALREKLRQGYYPTEAADAAVEYVKSFGYLNDGRYAENYVRSRLGTKSRREIEAALMKKGLAKELIDRAFEICAEDAGPDPDEAAIRTLLRKKRFDPDGADEAELRKIYAFLGRKGFRCETVRHVIQNYNLNA